LNAAQGKVPFAALGLSNVGPVQPGGFSHLFL
jgi:hypothetical protein